MPMQCIVQKVDIVRHIVEIELLQRLQFELSDKKSTTREEGARLDKANGLSGHRFTRCFFFVKLFKQLPET